MTNRTAYFYDPDVGNFHYGKVMRLWLRYQNRYS